MFTLQALKDEIVNDPEGLGYGTSGAPTLGLATEHIAGLINLRNLVLDRPAVDMEQIRGATEFDWYDALTIDEQEYLRWQTPNSGLWEVTAAMKLMLTGSQPTVNGVAGASTPTNSFWAAADRTVAIAAILPIIEIVGSRAEVLWGDNTAIAAGQVGRAFNLI